MTHETLYGTPVEATPVPTDAELSALALAADPEAPVAADAVPLREVLGGATASAPLPEWYLPSPAGVIRARTGWPRAIAIVLIVAFLAVDIAGLCNTYGLLQLA